jgi:hypothetical protein
MRNTLNYHCSSFCSEQLKEPSVVASIHHRHHQFQTFSRHSTILLEAIGILESHLGIFGTRSGVNTVVRLSENSIAPSGCSTRIQPCHSVIRNTPLRGSADKLGGDRNHFHSHLDHGNHGSRP